MTAHTRWHGKVCRFSQFADYQALYAYIGMMPVFQYAQLIKILGGWCDMKIIWYKKNNGRLYIENVWIGNVVKDSNNNVHLDNINGRIIR